MRSEKHLLPLPPLLAICCLGTLHLSSGFPQSVPSYLEGLDIPESEIPSFVMDLCSSIYNRMKVNEENNHEIYKRFLFQFSRAKDPSLKIGESQIATAEYTKRDSSGIVGRPFFLFRPRNGRKVSINEH
uniref:Neuromedin-S n=1 Tax=Bombina variegata TaxID=8348 RepID=NMS_BOMVA|nr:RecName: Full=Neuromedin-S; Contains: RecName: Full=Neuromedin-S-17; Short=NmS-17; Flags: Precursor [Bombina variegata]CAJ40982.1 nms-17 protein [Bombina variegata]